MPRYANTTSVLPLINRSKPWLVIQIIIVVKEQLRYTAATELFIKQEVKRNGPRNKSSPLNGGTFINQCQVNTPRRTRLHG